MCAAGPFKIVILGEGRVGKTSLLRQYVSGTFDANEASTDTESVAHREKVLTLRSRQVHLSLWDTAGQERFHSLAPIYYRGADGALLVYDITDIESFKRVAKWVEELSVAGSRCVLAIVGNKTDLRPQARVPLADAEAYARSISARHSLASAKLGQGVEEMFTKLAEDVLDFRLNADSCQKQSRQRTRSRAPLVRDDFPQQRSAGCCGGR